MDVIKHFDKKKILADVSKIVSLPLLIYSAIGILHVLGGIGDGWLSVLGIAKDSGPYYMLANYIYNEEKEWILKLILFFIIIAIVVYVVMYLCSCRKERFLIIEHGSLNKISFKINKEALGDFSVKEFKVDQFDIFEKHSTELSEMINLLIDNMDDKVKKIRELVAKDYAVGYAGIANIPATFLLGFELGDENRKKYFHKYHDIKSDENKKNDEFFLLSSSPDHSTLTATYKDACNPRKANKLLLVIELTHPIEEADYKNVQEDNDCVIIFKCSDEIGYDLLDTETKIENYADSIIAEVARLQKYPDIQEIKICISASGNFVFALGTKFSKTQNKDIVVYHFQNKSYPWGINVTKKLPVVNV